ncbi:hypothetical protein Hanom_Chr02g00178111 [Helianthus anomalus]
MLVGKLLKGWKYKVRGGPIRSDFFVGLMCNISFQVTLYIRTVLMLGLKRDFSIITHHRSQFLLSAQEIRVSRFFFYHSCTLLITSGHTSCSRRNRSVESCCVLFILLSIY